VSELADRIAAVVAARAANPLDTEREDAAHEALADYVLARAVSRAATCDGTQFRSHKESDRK
jgi:hypothetical protein